MLAYLAAMVCYAGEYAFGSRSHIGKAANPRPATGRRRRAGGRRSPAVTRCPTRPPEPPGGRVGRPHRGRRSTSSRCALHLGTLVTRGIAAERMPWGNMYEYILSVRFVGSAVWLGVLLRRPALRHLGLFVHAGAGDAARRGRRWSPTPRSARWCRR